MSTAPATLAVALAAERGGEFSARRSTVALPSSAALLDGSRACSARAHSRKGARSSAPSYVATACRRARREEHDARRLADFEARAQRRLRVAVDAPGIYVAELGHHRAHDRRERMARLTPRRVEFNDGAARAADLVGPRVGGDLGQRALRLLGARRELGGQEERNSRERSCHGDQVHSDHSGAISQLYAHA